MHAQRGLPGARTATDQVGPEGDEPAHENLVQAGHAGGLALARVRRGPVRAIARAMSRTTPRRRAFPHVLCHIQLSLRCLTVVPTFHSIARYWPRVDLSSCTSNPYRRATANRATARAPSTASRPGA